MVRSRTLALFTVTSLGGLVFHGCGGRSSDVSLPKAGAGRSGHGTSDDAGESGTPLGAGGRASTPSGAGSGPRGGNAGKRSISEGGAPGQSGGGRDDVAAGRSQGGASGNDAGGAASGGESGTGRSGATVCGDGRREGAEQCDDGNLVDGDGCDDGCGVEPGWACREPDCDADGCRIRIAATYRDFNAHAAPGGHPDFEPGFNAAGPATGLVEQLLDEEGKPVLSSSASSSALAAAYFHGAEAFAQWYRDDPPSSGPIPGELVLWQDGADRFVNRFGAHGEAWERNLSQDDYGPIVYGGPGGTGCEACTPSATGACYDPCIPWGPGSTEACCAEEPDTQVDGNPLFYPIDTADGTLEEPRSEGKIPQAYGWAGWPWESSVATALGVAQPIETALAPFPSKMHNYNFTSEFTYRFRYRATMYATVELGTDDDGWLFLNGRLAVDMGGWHVPARGTLTIDGGTLRVTLFGLEDDFVGGPPAPVELAWDAADFGLTDGDVYLIKVFHAERQVEGSTLRFAISGFDAGVSLCAPE